MSEKQSHRASDRDHDRNSLPMPEYRRRVVFCLAAGSLVVAGFLWLLFAPSTLLLIFAAVWFGSVMHHAAGGLAGWSRLPRHVALAVVAVVLTVVIVGTFVLLGFQIAQQLNEFALNLKQAAANVINAIEQRFPVAGDLLQQTSLRQIVAFVLQGAVGSVVASWITTPLGFLLNLLFIVATGLYLAAEASKYRDGFVMLFPADWQPRLRGVLDEMSYSLWRWTLTRLASMAIVGTLSGIGLWLLGVPLAPTLGVLTGLIVFLPNIGPLISVVPPMLLSFSLGPWAPLYVLFLYAGIQFVESYLITPILHEHENSLPAALIIITQLVLGVLFGLLGLAFAMPLTLVIKIGIERLYLGRVKNEAA